MKVKIKNSTSKIMGYDVEYKNEAQVAVKVTSPCTYCSEPVSYLRGGVYSGDKYHHECYVKSGDSQKHYDSFSQTILKGLTPAQYQAKHGVAWNE